MLQHKSRDTMIGRLQDRSLSNQNMVNPVDRGRFSQLLVPAQANNMVISSTKKYGMVGMSSKLTPAGWCRSIVRCFWISETGAFSFLFLWHFQIEKPQALCYVLNTTKYIFSLVLHQINKHTHSKVCWFRHIFSIISSLAVVISRHNVPLALFYNSIFFS